MKPLAAPEMDENAHSFEQPSLFLKQDVTSSK